METCSEEKSPQLSSSPCSPLPRMSRLARSAPQATPFLRADLEQARSGPDDGPDSSMSFKTAIDVDRGGSAASPARSDFAEFQDCMSEVGSLGSSQDLDDGSTESGPRLVQEGRSRRLSDSALERRLEAEVKRRVAAEEAAAELRWQREALSNKVLQLQQRDSVAQHLTETHTTAAAERLEQQVTVARLVSSIAAAAAARDAERQRWAGEVAMLRRRVERTARMEDAIERQHERDAAARRSLRRQAGHALLAAGCIGAGALGAWWLIMRATRPADGRAVGGPVLPLGGQVERQGGLDLEALGAAAEAAHEFAADHWVPSGLSSALPA